MGLAHPAINTRDTALFLSFRRTLGYRPRAMVPLAELVKRFMGRDIEQNGDSEEVTVNADTGEVTED